MLDYHQNCVALSEFTAALSGVADPALAAARDQAVAAVSAERGSALLGAFVHHLIGHAASDGAEIALLQRAADLWAKGLALCDQLTAVRTGLESALENPGDPGSPAKFNAAAMDVQSFGRSAVAMMADIDALRADVLKFPHLPRHPRQADLKTDQWNWGDLVLGRRTEALVRSVSALARDAGDAATTAFATGAISSYAANVAASPYIAFAVGGPRRAHRQRDRIARNAIGAWFAANSGAAISPTQMADRITFGPANNPELPDAIRSLVQGALAKTFDLQHTQPLPDLQLGYARLVQHLRLLDKFPRPAVPAPPNQMWLAALYSDPQNPPGSLRPQDVDVTGQDGGGVAVQVGDPQPGTGQPNGSDSSKTAKGCGIAVLIIIAIDLIQAFVQCVGQWANGHRCTFWENMLLSKVWEQDPPDPHDPNGPTTVSVTGQQLTTIAGSPQAASLVGQLFDLHGQAWEAMDKAYVFLCVAGLIYPGHLLASPLYSQFTAMPAHQPWPHREAADPPYHLYPSSPLELPTVPEFPYAPGTSPQAALSEVFEGLAAIGLALWRQIATNVQDSQNRDLDADRGRVHPCWNADGSINDDPVAVRILAYEEQ